MPPFLPVVCLTVSAEQKLALQGLYHQYVKRIFFSPCQAVLLHIRLLSIKANVKYQVPMCNIKNLLQLQTWETAGNIFFMRSPLLDGHNCLLVFPGQIFSRYKTIRWSLTEGLSLTLKIYHAIVLSLNAFWPCFKIHFLAISLKYN